MDQLVEATTCMGILLSECKLIVIVADYEDRFTSPTIAKTVIRSRSQGRQVTGAEDTTVVSANACDVWKGSTQSVDSYIPASYA